MHNDHSPAAEGRDERWRVADVEPIDPFGLRTVTIGTVLWVVAFVALLPFYDTLRETGRLWWLWTCLGGFGMGLCGIELSKRRARRDLH